MLKSRKTDKDLERIAAVFGRDFGDILAESFTVRHFSGIDESEFPGMVEKLREGLLLFMTSSEIARLKRRIEQEVGAGLPENAGIDADE